MSVLSTNDSIDNDLGDYNLISKFRDTSVTLENPQLLSTYLLLAHILVKRVPFLSGGLQLY